MAQELSAKSGSASPSAEDEARYVLSFIDQARKPMDEIQPIVEECLSNFLVKPFTDTNWYLRTDKPYYTSRDRQLTSGATLKDPESHISAMSLASKIIPSLFGKQGFVRSKPVGLDDVLKSNAVDALLHYDLRKAENYLTLYCWAVDGIWSPNGILKAYWRYEEDERSAYNTSVYDGVSLRNRTTETYVAFDDPCLVGVDLMKFYPDTGHDRIDLMIGCADETTITAREAMDMVDKGKFDKDAVQRAISNQRKLEAKKANDSNTSFYRRGLDQPVNAQIPDEFLPLKLFEYWGDTPFPPDTGMKRRRVLSVLNGELVRRRSWFLPTPRLPYFDFTPNPRQGSFYGMSPLEVVRYHQDFLDAMLMNVADGSMRSVRAQPLVNRNAQVDVAKLRRPTPDLPVMTNDVEAVKYLDYNPPLEAAWRFMQEMKAQMRQGTAAVPALQGLGIGVDRASATEAQATFAAAMDRPELMTEVLERTALPPLGRFLLALNQEYLDDAGLAVRIGQQPGFVSMADIDGDFDIEFVGSRLMHSQQEELAMMERIEAQVKTSPFAAIFPWVDFYKRWLKVAELPELEALVAQPQGTAANVILQMLAQGNQGAGNFNGTAPSVAPQGMMPAQEAGGVQ